MSWNADGSVVIEYLWTASPGRDVYTYLTLRVPNVLANSKCGLFAWLGNPGITHENSAATASQISIASGSVAVADGDCCEYFFQTSDTSTGLEVDRTSSGIEVVEDADAFHVIGGNQNDGVSIRRWTRKNLIEARRCPWRINQPPNVRRVMLSGGGALSTAGQ